MRVLLDVSAVPARPVGAGVYTVALAAALAVRTDMELVLLTRTDDAPRWSTIAPMAEVHAVVPTRRPVRLVWEQLRAPRWVRAHRIDVWHGPHYTLPLRLDLPTVVTVHDLTFFDRPEVHERSKVVYFQRMIRAALAHAAVVVTVSQTTADRLASRFTPSGTVIVAPHGVDHERFNPTAERAHDLELLARHGVYPPFIGFTGTIEPRKDLPNLVAAFARVAADRPDLRLVLAGPDGWGTTALRTAVEASGVATRILRTGYLPEETVPALLRRAEVVAYPPIEEGFGLPALEALACGAPLVTTTGSACEEVVGDAAALVPPHDVDALAASLEQLLTNPTEAARLRAIGPPRAAQYTWNASAQRHVDAYRRAIGANS